jgi:hypothetical protein
MRIKGGGTLFNINPIMEKIKNGDSVIYKDRKGTIYGKPRENKYRGVLYTVKIGDDYVKATASELSLEKEPEPEPVSAWS